MILANELRLGNWVEEEVLGRVRIVAILSDTVAVVGKGMKMDRAIEDREFSLNLSNIKPVPLTPEILEKCGFEKQEDGDGGYYRELLSGNGFLFVEGDKKGYTDVFIDLSEHLRVRYVHQLQNLYFALTGEELTINLP